jgi:hypothetical protein
MDSSASSEQTVNSREMAEQFPCFSAFLCFTLAAMGVVRRDGPVMTEASVNIGTSTRAAV